MSPPRRARPACHDARCSGGQHLDELVREPRNHHQTWIVVRVHFGNGQCGDLAAAQEDLHRSHTEPVAKAISVRLDDEAERALRLLESTGLSQSEAIRSSLLASADRTRRRKQLAAEVAALEADADDRNEMLEVAALMESLRAAG